MKKLIIIGGGPGGYTTAIEAASKGLEVVLISDGPLGGTCLNEGCIPTKSLYANALALETVKNSKKMGIEIPSFSFEIKRAIERKNEVVKQLRAGIEFLFKKNGVRFISGKASFKDAHTVLVRKNIEPDLVISNSEELSENRIEEEILFADYIIIATGSNSAILPIPGNDLAGVLTSTQMLNLTEVPKKICVIGAGVIGLEFASIFNSFGSEVEVLEFAKNILPHFDKDLAKRLKKELKNRGVSIETEAKVESIAYADGTSCNHDAVAKNARKMLVTYERKGVKNNVEADKVLMAVGRRPALNSLNLNEIGIEFTPKGIVVDDKFRTNIPHIYAIGDILGGLMLAHVAEYQGTRVIENILQNAPKHKSQKQLLVPAAVFTIPEAASVGMTEEECKEANLSYKAFKSNYKANGKAVSMGENEGYYKILASDDGENIYGCHIFGAHASDLIHEVAAHMYMGSTLEDIKHMIHAHPTLSELLPGALT